MGCAASVGASRGAAPIAAQNWKQKIVSSWSEEDVEAWFRTIPETLQVYKTCLLPADGDFVVSWSETLLLTAGVSNEYHRKQLLAYKDKVLRNVHMTSSTEASSREAGGTPRKQPAAQKLKDALKIGAVVAKTVLDEVGPALPFGGAAAAALVCKLIDMVEGACTTNDNLVDLRNRAADLLDIIIDRKEALLEKQLYVNIIARFDDLLQEIIKYAEDYTTRNWVVRVLTSTNDGTHYEELQQHLRELTVEAHFAITVDVHSMTVEVRDMLQALEASQARYMDHGARLRELIASNGGMTQVLASPDKLDMVLEQMGPTEKLTIAFMQQAVSSLQASQDEGVHLLIEQPSMRVFWRKLFRHKWRIPWDRFWSVFPGQLRLADVPANEVQQIEEFLRRAEQKLAFQASVEKNDPGYVSVDEITTSFPGDAPLVHSVKQLTAGNAVALGSDSSTGASGASTTVQLVQPPRCNLPELDELYCGRESAAAALANDLAGGLPEVVCITADPGYGKSSFAVDVGRRLWLAGAASGGTILVDMRKVHSKREVDAAFCAALSIDQDPTDSTARIVARVKALAYSSTAPAAVVMVIDNAEDPLNSAGSSHLLAVLAKVQDAVPIARLLVTSRSPFPEEVAGGGSSTGEQLEQQRPKVRHHQLGALQPAAAEQLIRRYVEVDRLSDSEAADVARLCGGVPLTLRLVADSLKCDRVDIEDVRIASDAAAAANSDSLVAVMLSALPKRQLTALAQMALFPTIFSASGAEAAMACDAPKAKALLMVHLQHGFVRFDSREAVYSLHPRVQQGLASIPVKVDLQATREAVALHCVDNLGLWAKLYSTGEASAHALHKGRQHQADIVQLLQLLGDQDAKPSLRVVQALALVAKPAALGRYLYPLGIMGLPAMVKAWENASRLLKEMGDEVLYSSSISMLAWSLRTANYYGSASEHGSSEELFREALEIRTRVLGPDHVDTLVSLSALGSSLQMQGRSAEAEPIFRDVLEKRRKITDADVTEAMANLAWTLQSLNRSSEAQELQEQVLELRVKAQGEEHPDALTALRALAGCVLNQGRAAESEPLLRRALELRSKVLGATHPDTLVVVGLLAQCLEAQGRLSEAAEQYGAAADLWTQVAGHDHAQAKRNRVAREACGRKGDGSMG